MEPSQAKLSSMEWILEHDLTCAVWLGVYQDPVSLSCGHSFCRVCIKQAILGQEGKCPLCQTALSRPLELKKNDNLANIVETFKAKQGQPPATSMLRIPCDNCLEPDKAAVRTCLDCQASLCPLHLEKHNAKPAFKGHTLLPPTSSLESRKCPLHDKLLECYCQDDQACICMMCSIAGPHKGHRITTLKEQHHSMLAELSQTMKTQENNASAMADGLKSIQDNQKNIKKNSANLGNELADLFKNIHLEVDKLQKEMMDAVTSNEMKQLWEIKKTEAQMEEKKKEALRNVQELQDLKKETDPALFIKAFVSAKERLKKQDFNTRNARVANVQLNQSVKKTITAKTSEHLASVKTLLKPLHGEIINQLQWFSATPADGKLISCNEWNQYEFVQEIPLELEDELDYDFTQERSYRNQSVRANLTFRESPQEARFIISRNRKSLTHNVNVPKAMFGRAMRSKPSQEFPAAVCSQSFCSGECFWDVDTAHSSSWSVGVTTCPNPDQYVGSVHYVGGYSSWFVQWDGRRLVCFPGTQRHCEKTHPPQQIRVQLNFNEKSVYFYDLSNSNRAQPVLLYHNNTLLGTVYPGFNISDGSLTLV